MAETALFGVSPVNERLIIGGQVNSFEHMAWLAQQGITHVISAAAQASDRLLCDHYRLGYYHVYWHDDGQPKPLHTFVHVLGWVRRQELEEMARPRPRPGVGLYIHCQMGINRGPLLATFLLAASRGLSGDDAWSLIKESRPQAEAFAVPAYRESCLRALEGARVNAIPETAYRLTPARAAARP